MTLENNRAPLLYYVKFCASFQSHGWIKQTGVTETLNSGQNLWFILVLCDLEIWQMTLKTIEHLLYITLSFFHHFKAIREFKPELQSGNAQFGSKSTIFCPEWPSNLMDDLEKKLGHLLCQALCFISQPSLNSNLSSSLEMLNWVKIGNFLSHVTLKFNRWPWKTIRHFFFYTMLRFVHHLKAISAFKLKLQWGNSKFWSKLVNLFPVWPWHLVTLKNDRAPVPCCFKLCASFYGHQWIQTGVKESWNTQFGSKSIFLAIRPWKFDGDLEKL